MSEFLSFHLSDDFLKKYEKMEPEWGFDIGGGNSLSELTFIAKYSRKKEDGSKERWYEVCQRCIEGMYSILKDHAKYQRTPWNEFKAQKSAQDAYERMFHFKWTPPGRGLQHMGTEYIHTNRNGSRLINCSAISTEKISAHSAYEATMPFVRLMEMSMSGIGVGVDCRGAGRITLHQPSDETEIFVVPDTREGWAASLGKLLESFFFKNRKTVKFDYSEVRPEGAPLKSFSGTASGPDPLRRMHEQISELLSNREGELLTSRDIVDITNLTGKATVAGGSRRCLPSGTMVKTSNGFRLIEDIQVGDIVSTIDGEYPVLNKFEQGNQETVIIKHAYGEFECTGNHRMAIWDSPDSWTFKEAKDLTSEDRLVWDFGEWTGEDQELPPLNMMREFDPSYVRNTGRTAKVRWEGVNCAICDRPAGIKTSPYGPLCHAHSNRLRKYGDPLKLRGWGSEVKLPTVVTPEFAWFIGYFHGNGNLVVENEGKATIRLACPFTYPENVDRIVAILKELCPDNKVSVSQGDGQYVIISMSSARLGNWLFEHVKQPSSDIHIPSWIMQSTAEVRKAYLAGLFDSDGSDSRDLRLVSTVYKSLADELVNLCISLGFHPAVRSVDRSAYGWKTIHNVDMPGYEFRRMAVDAIAPYASSKLMTYNDEGRQSGSGMMSFPAAIAVMAGVPSGRSRANKSGCVGLKAVVDMTGLEVRGFPVPIREVVTSGRVTPTWDIEVESIHQFTAGGFVTHNSALISFGEIDDEDYVNLKNWELEENAKRTGMDGWAWASNNSVLANSGDDLSSIIDKIAINGEPGILWVDLMRKYGRLEDVPNDRDYRTGLTNPCGEIGLEGGGELCNLSELYPMNHDSIEDFKRTIKHAYMYCKAVTLLPTPWMETNEIIIRNRRIGVSMTGIAEFVETRGWSEIKDWMDVGYRHLVELDKSYSEWLGVRESIKLSTVKPAGSTSLLAATTSGVHWPTTSGHFIRRIRFSKVDPLVDLLAAAGYRIEDDRNDPKTTVVAEFPTTGVKVRSERDVSVWEKAQLAALAQRYWSDNLVSCTLSFTKAEQDSLGPLLASMDGQLKSASFLPIDESGTTYEQAPYEPLDSDVAVQMQKKIKPLNTAKLYASGIDAKDEKFCNTDSCEISFG